MITYLILQTTYSDIEIGFARDGNLIEKRTVSKFQASSHLLITIQDIISINNIMLSDLAFIAANCGPGPFTTLRVALTTINGLGYAAPLPLIGLNGLQSFLEEHHTTQYPVTIALFNAFGNDVYTGIHTHDGISINCTNIETLLHSLHQKYPNTTLRFIGQASTMYKDKIKALYNDKAVVPEGVEQCSLAYLSQQAYIAWNNKKTEAQLTPIYLKNTVNNITI